jgi:hypothetical protein
VDGAALHIGQACQVPPEVAEAGAASTIIDVELECPSRFCVLPARETATDTTSLCAADCSSDDDCLVAEVRVLATRSSAAMLMHGARGLLRRYWVKP